MPTLAVFYGITIAMFADEHPPPHFHVRHGGSKASVAVADGRIIEGRLPRTVARRVQEWRQLHTADLVAAWDTLMTGNTPDRIVPLP